MARLGRSFPIPVTIRGRLTYHRADVTLGIFESPSEWVPLEVTTPNVNLTLGVFESLSEWPALEFVNEQRFTLGTFESLSEWPSLSVTVPVKPGDSLTGADGQAEWNGTLWGAGTDVGLLIPVDGWLGSPNIDNLNVQRPSRHGAWEARKLAQQRIVSLRLQPRSSDDPTQVHELIDDIFTATPIGEGDEPFPLVIKAYGPARLAFGQVVDRPLVLDGDYNAGLPTVGVIIACGDPRLYSLEQHGVTIPLNVPTGLSNAGNQSTHPLLRVEGPSTNPVITNSTLSRVLQFAIELVDGEVMEIDTNRGTVTVGGDNRMSTLTGSSVPVTDLVLGAGSTTLQYTTSGGGSAGLDALWRDAWL